MPSKLCQALKVLLEDVSTDRFQNDVNHNQRVTEWDVCEAGDSLMMQPNAPHTSFNKSEHPCRMVSVSIHSWLLLRRGRNRFDEVAIGIALCVDGTAVLIQSVSGDALARMVAVKQPMKLASLDGQLKTEVGAPLSIGGLPFLDERVTKYAIKIPHGLSLLAFHTPNALIRGLDQEPSKDWPNVRIVHMHSPISTRNRLDK